MARMMNFVYLLGSVTRSGQNQLESKLDNGNVMMWHLAGENEKENENVTQSIKH